MSAAVVAATVVAVAVLASALLVVVGRGRGSARNTRTVPAVPPRPPVADERPAPGAPTGDARAGSDPLGLRYTRRERVLLVGPPVIDGVTLRDWLVHHTHRDGVWEDVVAEFYRRAAADPRVAAYFTGVDIAQLQRHFLAVLAMLVHSGLHRHTLERMASTHRAVTTPGGRPITGEVWDVVVSTLVGVLVGHGVPTSVVEPLGAVVEPLRAVIVVEP